MSFNFMAAVTVCSDFGAQEKKIVHCFHFFPIYLPWSVGTGCHGLGFLNVALSQFFRFPLSPSSRGSLVLLHSLPLKWYHLHIWGKMLKVLNVNSATKLALDLASQLYLCQVPVLEITVLFSYVRCLLILGHLHQGQRGHPENPSEHVTPFSHC